MADDTSRQAPQHDSDYDGAWKEALRGHLPQFIEKYFPSEYAAIDWRQAPEWFDKELSQVLGESGRRNLVVDVLVKVRLLTGREQWILLHLEIQTSYEEDFAVRIARYNAGLHWVSSDVRRLSSCWRTCAAVGGPTRTCSSWGNSRAGCDFPFAN